MGWFSTIDAKEPKKEKSSESSEVKIELFLNVFIDGYDTGNVGSKFDYTNSLNKSQSNRTTGFKLNYQVSALDNPDAKPSPNEEKEDEVTIHKTFKLMLMPYNKRESYHKQIRKALKNLSNFIDKYVFDHNVKEIDVHFSIVTYNQGDIITNLIQAEGIDGEDSIINKELEKTFDFRKYINNDKIKYCKVDSFSVIDVIANECTFSGDAALQTTGFTIKEVSFPDFLLSGVKCIVKGFVWLFNEAVNGFKLLAGQGGDGYDLEKMKADFNYPSKDRITPFDAAVMCQHTYDSETVAHRSVPAMYKSIRGNSPQLADKNSTTINVTPEMEKKILETKKKLSNTDEDFRLTGKVSTISNWIPVNEGEEILKEVAWLANPVTGFYSKLYKRTIENGRLYYAYVTAGTEPSSLNDWIFANVLQGLLGLSAQHTRSVHNAKKFDKYCKKNKYGLFFIGHSLGGGLASNNCIVTSSRHAITFNAAGLHPLRIMATVLINNPMGYFKREQRERRVHTFILNGEAVQALKYIGQPSLGIDHAVRFDTDTIISSEGEPITKLGHLSPFARHAVTNFLLISEFMTLEIND